MSKGGQPIPTQIQFLEFWKLGKEFDVGEAGILEVQLLQGRKIFVEAVNFAPGLTVRQIQFGDFGLFLSSQLQPNSDIHGSGVAPLKLQFSENR